MRSLKVVVNAIPAANPVTGIGRYVLQLYEAIREIGGRAVDVRFYDGRTLAPEPPRGPRDLGRFTRLGRLYWRLPVAASLPVRLALHWKREREFRRLSAGADVYHETAFFPFRAAPGVAIVQTVHDLSLQLHPEWHPAERVAYARRYFRERLAWSSRILCVSEFTRGELVGYAPAVAARVTVTPLGVDARFRRPPPPALDELRRRRGLPGRYLLFVGSGDPRKNMAALASLVARGRLDCPVVCAGWQGWLADGGAGAPVRVLGYVPDADLPALYGAALGLVFPSLHEGFGLPVLEAMACGCPVVVPDAHSMPELVGEAGIRYGAPTDIEALEAAVARLVGDPALRARLAQAGVERARAFDWKRTARLTLDALENAASIAVPRTPRGGP